MPHSEEPYILWMQRTQWLFSNDSTLPKFLAILSINQVIAGISPPVRTKSPVISSSARDRS